MKLSDLKTGMWVKVRGGGMYLVLKDYESVYYGKGILASTTVGFIPITSYSEDLEHEDLETQDIVQAFIPESDSLVLDRNQLKSIWIRRNVPTLVKELLKKLNKTYKNGWIAKDSDGRVGLFYLKPFKSKDGAWISLNNNYCYLPFGPENAFCEELFSWLSWDDEEPTYIPGLLKERRE